MTTITAKYSMVVPKEARKDLNLRPGMKVDLQKNERGEWVLVRVGAHKKTSTLLGRVRFLPDINSPNRNVRQFAERTAINTPIQGTAADLLKLAMIRIDAAFSAKNLRSAMLLTVHDELVFEVPPDELAEVSTLVKVLMEEVWELKAPLKVNVEWGRNWAEVH